MKSFKKITLAITVTSGIALTATVSGFADRIDPSLIPPDVTLTTGSSGASSAAAPGLGGAASAPAGTAAAVAPAAPPGRPAIPMPAVPTPAGQPLPPGAVPTAPPPPTGSGSFGGPPVNQAKNYAMFQTTTGNGPNAAPDVSKDPIAVIDTPKGQIKIRLFKSLAPKTVDNFLELAQSGFYNGLTFHRVEANFCIQGGDPLGTGYGMFIDQTTKQPRFIPLEIAPSLKHNAPGVVAMAHGPSPNSASSQFYITLSPQPALDGKYAIFGGVISGMEAVRAIVKGDKMTTVSIQMP